MTPSEVTNKRKVTGDLEALSLFDVCQFLMIAGKSGVLRVEDAGKRASLTWVNGRIVSATDETLKEGEEAVLRILVWARGMFEFTSGGAGLQPTHPITASTGAMLLEAARQMDEGETAAKLEAEGMPPEAAQGSHAVTFLQQQRFVEEFAELFTSLEAGPEDDLDFRKDVPLETLVHAATRRGSTRLHLEEGRPVRLRGANGFSTLGASAVTRRVLDRLAATLGLGGPEKTDVRERRVEGAGLVRCESVPAGDGRRLTIDLMAERAPRLALFGLPEPRILPSVRARSGLLLVASAPRGGKSALCAALVEASVATAGRHVAYFEEAACYRIAARDAVIECFDLAGDADRGSIAEQVWRRKSDVVVIDAIRTPEHAAAALDAAAGGALVLASVEACDVVDAAARMLARLDAKDRAAEAARMAELLLGIVAVRPLAATGADGATFECEWLPGSDAVRDALRRMDGEALAACLFAPDATTFPKR